MPANDRNFIQKTYNCELPGNKGCGLVYHVMTAPELEWYKRMTKKEQDTFDNTLLTTHLKSCFNAGHYAKNQ